MTKPLWYGYTVIRFSEQPYGVHNPMADKAKGTRKTPPVRVAESMIAVPLTPAPKSERKPLKG
jgi:hypothetical protein